ncbi:MAG: DUF2336 domain-containing protein [Lactobacillus sp.]|jgi:uncharacterized protein (DUF2336 family)|nr:DUF2336 domain-containing protein [Lactobacillus sp.]
MSNKLLTKEDVLKLSQDKSAEMRSKTAQKLSAYYNNPDLSQKEMKLAEDIFRIMVEDVEVKVREVLSESLKNSKDIPEDIVNKLINDKESVAIPFIKHYQNLTKELMYDILDAQNVEKQKAVAQRKNVSEDVSDYIVDKCNEAVIESLVSNSTSKIKEKTFNNIVDKFHSNEKIKEKIVYRPEIPVSVAEKIVIYLSDELQKKLVTNHSLPNDLVVDIVEQVKEKSTLKISEEFSSDTQVEELVKELYDSNNLTSSLVVRSICMGDLKFFEYSLGLLSSSPILEVRKILFNTQIDFMVRNLLRKAFIPKTMFPAVFSALKVLREINFDSKLPNRKNFVHKVIERILSYENASEELSEEDVNYLISKIS